MTNQRDGEGMSGFICCFCRGTVDALGYPLGSDPDSDSIVGPFCWECYNSRYSIKYKKRIKREVKENG